MLKPFVRRFRQKPMDVRVREALESGVGLYHNHWRLDTSEGEGLRRGDAPEAIIDWCRKTIAQMRRPYGLDYVTLALAVLDEESKEAARVSFGVLRPSDFYGEGRAVSELAGTVSRWRSEGLFDGAGDLSAVMFSWGDITRELMLAG